MRQHDVVAALERQLKKNAKERAWLEEQLRLARAFYLDGGDEMVPHPPRTRKPALLTRRVARSAFTRTPGGLADTVERIIKDQPGIKVSDLLDAAVKVVKTGSKDPRENLRETLRYRIKTGRVARHQDDSLHWIGK